MTYVAFDGKEYAYDTWYRLPFLIGGLAMVPVSKSPLPHDGGRLELKFPDGTVTPWFAFFWEPEGRDKQNAATHWRRVSWSDYEI